MGDIIESKGYEPKSGLKIPTWNGSKADYPYYRWLMVSYIQGTLGIDAGRLLTEEPDTILQERNAAVNGTTDEKKTQRSINSKRITDLRRIVAATICNSVVQCKKAMDMLTAIPNDRPKQLWERLQHSIMGNSNSSVSSSYTAISKLRHQVGKPYTETLTQIEVLLHTLIAGGEQPSNKYKITMLKDAFEPVSNDMALTLLRSQMENLSPVVGGTPLPAVADAAPPPVLE